MNLVTNVGVAPKRAEQHRDLKSHIKAAEI